MKLSRFLLVDLPFGQGIGQAPLWLFWFQKVKIILFSVFISLFIIFLGLVIDNDLLSVGLFADFIVLAQPFLFINYLNGRKININLYFISIICSIVYLIIIFFPDFKTFFGFWNKGIDSLRFSFLSSEPSYFAEVILLIIFLYSYQKKKFPWLFFIYMVALTRSTTLIQSIILFNLIYLFSFFYPKKIKTKIIIFFIPIVLISIVIIYQSKLIEDISKFMMIFGGSWRQASNFIGFQLFDFFPISDFRTQTFLLSESYGFSWMKEAIFSFFPWILVKYGLFLTVLYFIVFIHNLIKIIINKASYYISKHQLIYIIFALVHSMILSPKYNTSMLILLTFVLLNNFNYDKIRKPELGNSR